MNKKSLLIGLAISVIGLAFLGLRASSSSDKKEAKLTTEEATGIYHYNFLIVPDLSNRVDMKIHPKPIDDQEIISSVLSMIDEVLREGHRDTDQKDSYNVSFLNKGLILMYNIDKDNLDIDFADFDTQYQRIGYIKAREGYENNNLNTDIRKFEDECDKMYAEAVKNTDGADIWSFFNTGIGDSNVKSPEEPFEFNGHSFQEKYRNIIVLFTDGYMESGLSKTAAKGTSKNLSYDLSQSRIKAFREEFKKSGMSDMKTFFNENEYGIVPVENEYLKDIEVIVMELYDRSLTETGNATVYPTDNDIIELFWNDWLTKSGVKRFELHSCFEDVKSANRAIRHFALQK
ncbi:hypothetical protein [Saccharicrinis aurantiacus]|uniref:hypothetical protein n=1 Tax=Saccharicrinis aurantiacus TaxID=1849719 RepID=UPI002491B33C|nr:hypothetical protein [Saccharicrinis aurantiacus]